MVYLQYPGRKFRDFCERVCLKGTVGISKIMKRKGLSIRYSEPKMPVPYNQTRLYRFSDLGSKLKVKQHPDLAKKETSGSDSEF